jgi:hypothetical protein
MATPEEIADWLDDMARFNGVQVWNSELGCWVWEDTGEPVDQPKSDD